MTQEMEEYLATEERQHWVDQKSALDRLRKNPDFQKVILNGYLRDKALGAVSVLGDPAIKKRGERADLMEELVSISNLQYFFMMIDNMGSTEQMHLEDELDEDVQ